MSFLTLDHLQKSFGPTKVVHDFSLSVEQGEFVSFLGPSGCGKTTVLRMVAGFESPSAGRILIDGQDVTRARPNQRRIGMVFQAYALFPNLTVAENVGFGLKVAGVARAERASRVAEMLELIGLPDLGGRYPWQLSGGQQQRVALARALAPRPRVLLLDEPLSALDAKIRVSLRNQIREIQRQLGITTIFVTHDQEEALSISDRIVVMHQGVADQTGTPREIYDHPATAVIRSTPRMPRSSGWTATTTMSGPGCTLGAATTPSSAARARITSTPGRAMTWSTRATATTWSRQARATTRSMARVATTASAGAAAAIPKPSATMCSMAARATTR